MQKLKNLRSGLMGNGFKGDRNKTIQKYGPLYVSLMLLGQEVAELGPQAKSHNSI